MEGARSGRLQFLDIIPARAKSLHKIARSGSDRADPCRTRSTGRSARRRGCGHKGNGSYSRYSEPSEEPLIEFWTIVHTLACAKLRRPDPSLHAQDDNQVPEL